MMIFANKEEFIRLTSKYVKIGSCTIERSQLPWHHSESWWYAFWIATAELLDEDLQLRLFGHVVDSLFLLKIEYHFTKVDTEISSVLLSFLAGSEEAPKVEVEDIELCLN